MEAASEQGEVLGTEKFIVEVDGIERIWEKSSVTAEEIMIEAEISLTEGMVELLPDGTQRTVLITEVFEMSEVIKLEEAPALQARLKCVQNAFDQKWS